MGLVARRIGGGGFARARSAIGARGELCGIGGGAAVCRDHSRRRSFDCAGEVDCCREICCESGGTGFCYRGASLRLGYDFAGDATRKDCSAVGVWRELGFGGYERGEGDRGRDLRYRRRFYWRSGAFGISGGAGGEENSCGVEKFAAAFERWSFRISEDASRVRAGLRRA